MRFILPPGNIKPARLSIGRPLKIESLAVFIFDITLSFCKSLFVEILGGIYAQQNTLERIYSVCFFWLFPPVLA